MRTLTNKKKAGGFTLIELLFVLAIIGAIFYFTTRDSDKTEARTNANGFTTQMLSSIDTVKSTYKFSNYTDLSTQNLCESRAMTPGMCSGTGATTKIMHDFKGTLTFAPASCNGGTNNCFTITAAQVPGTACAAAVGSIQSKVSAISIGSTVVKNAATTYSQGAANTACNADTVTITFTAA